MNKSIIYLIFLSVSTFHAKADDKIEPIEKMPLFLSNNTAQTEVHNHLKKIKVESISIKNLSIRNAVRKLFDTTSKKKGDYSSLIIWTDSKVKINLDMKNTNLIAVMDNICKQSGLHWTIFFYNRQRDVPMLGVANAETIRRFAFEEPYKKNANKSWWSSFDVWRKNKQSVSQ